MPSLPRHGPRKVHKDTCPRMPTCKAGGKQESAVPQLRTVIAFCRGFHGVRHVRVALPPQ